MASLKDKIIVLTGASRGIGAAAARELATDGAHLVLCARSADACAETKAAVEALGATAEVHGFEVADFDAAKSFVDGVLADHGRIDILINNAGTGLMGSVADVKPDAYLEVLKINVMKQSVLVDLQVRPLCLQQNKWVLILVLWWALIMIKWQKSLNFLMII